MEVASAADRSVLRRALIFLILTNFIWGAYFPAMKALGILVNFPSLSRGASAAEVICAALSLLCLRFSVATILLYGIYPGLFRSLTKRSLSAGLYVAAAFGTGMACQITGLTMVSATRSALVTSMTVVIVPWIAFAVFRKRVSLRVILAGVMSFLGAAILVDSLRFEQGRLIMDWFAVGQGELVVFLGTLCFGVSICQIDYFNKQGIRAELNPGMFLGTSIATGIIAFFIGFFIPESHALLPSPFQGFSSFVLLTSSVEAGIIFLCIATIGTTLPFYWMNTYQGYFSAAHAALIYMFEPLSAAFWSIWLPGILSGLIGIDYPSETLSWSVILGGSIILIANLIPSLEE